MKINLDHIAIACSCEENVDKFYGELLGLEKLRSFTIPANLTKQIFNLDKEYKVSTYGADTFRLEIFIVDQDDLPIPHYNHICFTTDNRRQFIENCTSMGLNPNTVTKGDSVYLFIKDFDGNMFEIKEGKA